MEKVDSLTMMEKTAQHEVYNKLDCLTGSYTTKHHTGINQIKGIKISVIQNSYSSKTQKLMYVDCLIRRPAHHAPLLRLFHIIEDSMQPIQRTILTSKGKSTKDLVQFANTSRYPHGARSAWFRIRLTVRVD